MNLNLEESFLLDFINDLDKEKTFLGEKKFQYILETIQGIIKLIKNISNLTPENFTEKFKTISNFPYHKENFTKNGKETGKISKKLINFRIKTAAESLKKCYESEKKNNLLNRFFDKAFSPADQCFAIRINRIDNYINCFINKNNCFSNLEYEIEKLKKNKNDDCLYIDNKEIISICEKFIKEFNCSDKEINEYLNILIQKGTIIDSNKSTLTKIKEAVILSLMEGIDSVEKLKDFLISNSKQYALNKEEIKNLDKHIKLLLDSDLELKKWIK